jgi:hypothetical protein
MIRDISIEIGEKEIDKHTGEWLHIWDELTVPPGLRDGYNEMVGHWDVYPPLEYDANQTLQLSIPLRFWFCKNIGAAIPLVALQAHPVRIIVHLRPFDQLWWSPSVLPPAPGQPCPSIDPVAPSRIQLFGDYIFLETEDRRRLASHEHEYLIDQLQIGQSQTIPAGAKQVNVPLYFNHCCKEFIWVVQQTRMQSAREWFNYSSALQSNGGEPNVIPDDLLSTALLRLDGIDRFYRRNARYFRITEPYQHHTNVPNDYIYLFSFSLKPEDEQPSGTLNASKIDDITMNLEMNPLTLIDERSISFYATNYNVLRIVGGLGGLAFIA